MEDRDYFKILLTMFFTMFLLLMASCTHIKYVPIENTRVDSIYYTDTIITEKLVPYRDSVIVEVQGDSASSYLFNPYAGSWAVYNCGKLFHSLWIFDKPLQIDFKMPHNIKVFTRDVPIEVEKPLTRWQKAKQELGGIAFGVIGVLGVLGIIRIFALIRKGKL
jgi:hypothetical protein